MSIMLQQAASEHTDHVAFSTEQLAEVCHDLRAPVQMMLGTLTLLRSELGTPRGCEQAAADGYIDTLSRNGYKLLRMVNNLVDQARLDAGCMTLIRTPGDMVDTLRDLIVCARPYATLCGVRLVLSSHVDLLPMAYDAEKVERLLLNLLSNALKYTPAGGVVEMSIDSCAGKALISVRDSGPGIAPERLPTLFERYVTGERDSCLGSGIGLYIARCMARLHDGELSAHNVQGGGAVMEVTLPITHAATPDVPIGLGGLSERVRVEMADVGCLGVNEQGH